MLKTISFVKTLLTIYRSLDRLTNVIDKYVEFRAFGSLSSNLINYSSNTADRISESLGNLIASKICLINFKNTTNKLLSTIDKKYARILIMRYMDNLTYQQIATVLEIGERTAVRWHEKGLQECCEAFENSVFNCEKITNAFKSQKWIYGIYLKFNISKETPKFSKVHIFNTACNEYRLMAN